MILHRFEMVLERRITSVYHMFYIMNIKFWVYENNYILDPNTGKCTWTGQIQIVTKLRGKKS